MTPYYQDDWVTIYHGDCREILPLVGDGCEVVVTDPPYSSGGLQEMQRGGGSIGSRSPELVRFDALSTRGYERLLREVLRYVNQAEEIYLFTDWRMWVHAFDVVEASGWRVGNMLVWDKMQIGMGSPWRSRHELILFGRRIGASSRTGSSGNVLACARSGNQHHPTEKPVGLVNVLLSNAAVGCVIDPFMGSGTTLRAAKDLNRKAIGIEIEERYCEIAAKRMAQEVLAL